MSIIKIVGFGNNKTRKICGDCRATKKELGEIVAEKLFSAINFIESATSLNDIACFPSFHLHQLIGDRKDMFAMDLGRKIGYSYFEELGVVKLTKDKIQKVTNLLKYFAISSFSVFKKPDFFVQFRQTQCIDDKIVLNSNAWVQTVINFGKEMETKPFSEKKLKGYLPQIREMTMQNPSDFMPELLRILSECGVAFVLIPSLKNSGVYGATKWFNKEKVIVGMTVRGKNADVFWFSLFHELGHVLQRRITKTIIDFESSDSYDEYEKEADLFARNILIPSELYDSFVVSANFSEKNILNFADSIKIHPGIVVGRLQKDVRISYNYLNNLKQKYNIIK